MDKGLRVWGFFLVGAFCLAVSAGTLFAGGPLWGNLWCAQGKRALGETGLFFLWMLFFCCGPMKAWLRAFGVLLGFGAVLWLHQCFLPFAVSGLWLLGILMFGSLCLWGVSGLGGHYGGGEGQKEREGKRSVSYHRPSVSHQKLSPYIQGPPVGHMSFQNLPAAFLAGAGAWICLICVQSAFGIGGLGRVRLLAAALFVFSLSVHLVLFRKFLPEIFRRGRHFRKGIDGGRQEPSCDFLGAPFALLLTMAMIQIARVNLWPDYDSLHYGLRSPYILDNGRGIYENLGNINLVYTYPKGFEILSFPLAGTNTFGYTLCFNLWLTFLVLALTFGLAWKLSGDFGTGLLAATFVSMVPGVMNMAITAKSDTATLACQLCILCAGAGILTGEKEALKPLAGIPSCGDWHFGRPGKEGLLWWLAIGIGGCFLSFSMKPTSLVFSTVLSLSCFACCAPYLWRERKGIKGRICPAGIWGMAFLPLAGAGAWAGTWIRTYRMTGVPTTSVFTSIWEKLGFRVRWPFAFLAVPDQGLEMGFGDSLKFLGKRLFGILFSPMGEDMAHVVIAWGSSLMVMFLLAFILWGRRWKESQRGTGRDKAWKCLSLAALVIGGVSLVSVYLLWQVDGNYFMLLYVLLAVLGTVSMTAAGESMEDAGKGDAGIRISHSGRDSRGKQGSRGKRDSRGKQGSERRFPWMAAVVFGFCWFQAAVTIATSWSGGQGFTPIKVRHKGYVNHRQMVYDRFCSQGNQAIWSILSADPAARVIAVGEHPEVLQFPCNVQSYYDVTGSGGNVRLVKTLDNFKEFLEYAKIQYLYVQANFLEENTRCYDVVRFLVEDGSLGDIRYENGNMIARVNLHQEYPVDPAWEAGEFYRNIRMKEPQ